MAADLGDLTAFVAVARAGGFREASRAQAARAPRASAKPCAGSKRGSASGCSTAPRAASRPTEAGARLLDRLGPALAEVEAALDVVNGFRDRPAGTLRLNVPVSAARLVLPRIVPPFLAAYPDIRLEVIAEDSFVDMLAAGCDAGIRYDERLEQDMIAVPIGPRVQRFATAASPAYLDRARPPRSSARAARPCVLARPVRERRDDHPWEFERDGEIVKVESHGSAHRPGRRRHRPRGRCGGRRQRRHPTVRGLAASVSRQRRLGARAGTLVAALLGAVSLLSEPSPSARAACAPSSILLVCSAHSLSDNSNIPVSRVKNAT